MLLSPLSPRQIATLRRRWAVQFSFQRTPLWERRAAALPLRLSQRRKQGTVPPRLQAALFRKVSIVFRALQAAMRFYSFLLRRSKPASFPTYSAFSVCFFCSSGLPFYFSQEISLATKTPPFTTIRTGLPHQGEAPGSIALLIMEPMRSWLV